MRRFIFFAVLVAILIGGGVISAQLASNDGVQNIPAARIQTSDPEASVFVATEWQAQQFFLLIGFIVINLIGIGVTLAAIFWFLTRQIANVQADSSGGTSGSSAIQTAE